MVEQKEQATMAKAAEMRKQKAHLDAEMAEYKDYIRRKTQEESVSKLPTPFRDPTPRESIDKPSPEAPKEQSGSAQYHHIGDGRKWPDFFWDDRDAEWSDQQWEVYRDAKRDHPDDPFFKGKEDSYPPPPEMHPQPRPGPTSMPVLNLENLQSPVSADREIIYREGGGRNNYHQAKTVEIDPFPNPSNIEHWWDNCLRNISQGSGRNREALDWFKKVRTATSWEELENEGEFENWSGIVAKKLWKYFTGALLTETRNKEKKWVDQPGNTYFNGRQLCRMVLEDLKRPQIHNQISHNKTFLGLQMWNENLREYQESWNQELEKYNTADRPNDLILETLYEAQIRRCKHFEEDLKMFQIRIEMGNVTKNYHTLHEAVDNYIKKSKQKRNDALANKQRQGPTMLAAAKSPGDCSQYYYNGACSNIGKCPYEHSNCGGKASRRKAKAKAKAKTKTRTKILATMMGTQGKGPQLQEEEKMEKVKGVKAKMERARIKRKENRKAEEREARVEIAVAAILQVAPRNHHAKEKEKEKERSHHAAEKAQERAPRGANPPTKEQSRNRRQADHLQEYATPNFAHSTDKANDKFLPRDRRPLSRAALAKYQSMTD